MPPVSVSRLAAIRQVTPFPPRFPPFARAAFTGRKPRIAGKSGDGKFTRCSDAISTAGFQNRSGGSRPLILLLPVACPTSHSGGQ
jgi:hypothetical protein